ncbi:hypothetical protein LTR64_000119 [Lithohypha guttulata]|uniref:uncharacterized protein n=1 Tax=Lithohypha guttulata TaxID=1690604 RepID=UPI002DE0EC86|nr:hypothetical protein LTR51_007481 [Lithohypha guttulata]
MARFSDLPPEVTSSIFYRFRDIVVEDNMGKNSNLALSERRKINAVRVQLNVLLQVGQTWRDVLHNMNFEARCVSMARLNSSLQIWFMNGPKRSRKISTVVWIVRYDKKIKKMQMTRLPDGVKWQAYAPNMRIAIIGNVMHFGLLAGITLQDKLWPPTLIEIVQLYLPNPPYDRLIF